MIMDIVTAKKLIEALSDAVGIAEKNESDIIRLDKENDIMYVTIIVQEERLLEKIKVTTRLYPDPTEKYANQCGHCAVKHECLDYRSNIPPTKDCERFTGIVVMGETIDWRKND